MGRIRGFFQGKKTYLAGVLLIAVGVVGFVTEVGSVEASTGMILTGFGLMGLGAKAERHRKEILDALGVLKAAVDERPLTPEEKAELAGDVLSVGIEAALATSNPQMNLASVVNVGTPMLGMSGAVPPEASR